MFGTMVESNAGDNVPMLLKEKKVSLHQIWAEMNACTRCFANCCQRDRRMHRIVRTHGHHSEIDCVNPCGVLISHNNHLRWMYVVGHCWVLLDVVGLDVGGCCWILLGVAGCCWMLLDVIGCC